MSAMLWLFLGLCVVTYAIPVLGLRLKWNPHGPAGHLLWMCLGGLIMLAVVKVLL